MLDDKEIYFFLQIIYTFIAYIHKFYDSFL